MGVRVKRPRNGWRTIRDSFRLYAHQDPFLCQREAEGRLNDAPRDGAFKVYYNRVNSQFSQGLPVRCESGLCPSRGACEKSTLL